jgi:hypothetical protein
MLNTRRRCQAILICISLGIPVTARAAQPCSAFVELEKNWFENSNIPNIPGVLSLAMKARARADHESDNRDVWVEGTADLIIQYPRMATERLTMAITGHTTLLAHSNNIEFRLNNIGFEKDGRNHFAESVEVVDLSITKVSCTCLFCKEPTPIPTRIPVATPVPVLKRAPARTGPTAAPGKGIVGRWSCSAQGWDRPVSLMISERLIVSFPEYLQQELRLAQSGSEYCGTFSQGSNYGSVQVTSCLSLGANGALTFITENVFPDNSHDYEDRFLCTRVSSGQ